MNGPRKSTRDSPEIQLSQHPMHSSVIHSLNILAKFLGDGHEDGPKTDFLSKRQLTDKDVDDASSFTVDKSKSHTYNMRKIR